MNDFEKINKSFNTYIETLCKVINDEFYTDDKENLRILKDLVIKWCRQFSKTKSLIEISFEEIQKIYDITFEFGDKYMIMEPYEKNYSEILEFHFAEIERCWKDEIKQGGNMNDK